MKYNTGDDLLSPDEQLGFSTINKDLNQNRHESGQLRNNVSLPYSTG